MDYITIFEAGQQTSAMSGYLYALAIGGALLAAFGAFRLWKGRAVSAKAFGLLGLVLGLASLFFLGSFLEKHLESDPHGYERTVEGSVENFRGMHFSGHGEDSFTVDGINFSYSDYVSNGGYNKTVSHGGSLKEGVRVRLGYVEAQDGKRIIKKVEIKK